jgi:hypothetical protein
LPILVVATAHGDPLPHPHITGASMDDRSTVFNAKPIAGRPYDGERLVSSRPYTAVHILQRAVE